MTQQIANLQSFDRLIQNGHKTGFFNMGNSKGGQRCHAHSSYEPRTTNRVVNNLSEGITPTSPSTSSEPHKPIDNGFWE